MSTPRNHHYVSRVLSNNFLSNEGRIYRYSKVSRRISALNSTKGLFSSQDLNTVIDGEGNLDQGSVEQAISKHFESNFPKHYKVIMDFLAVEHEIGKPIPNAEGLIDAVKNILEMGFVGRTRHPLDMQRVQNVIFGAMMNLADNMTDELRQSMLSHFISKAKVFNKLPLDFPELSKGMIELMGETTYSIMLAPKDHYFLLPDCTATTQRFKLKDDVIDGKVFVNHGMAIGLVLMPINSNVLLTATKTEFAPNQGHGIYTLNEEIFLSYNSALFGSAITEVACQNRAYLENFVAMEIRKKVK